MTGNLGICFRFVSTELFLCVLHTIYRINYDGSCLQATFYCLHGIIVCFFLCCSTRDTSFYLRNHRSENTILILKIVNIKFKIFFFCGHRVRDYYKYISNYYIQISENTITKLRNQKTRQRMLSCFLVSSLISTSTEISSRYQLYHSIGNKYKYFPPTNQYPFVQLGLQ